MAKLTRIAFTSTTECKVVHTLTPCHFAVAQWLMVDSTPALEWFIKQGHQITRLHEGGFFLVLSTGKRFEGDTLEQVLIKAAPWAGLQV